MISNRLAWLVAFALFSAPFTVLAQGRPNGLKDHTDGYDHALELELDFSSVSLEWSDSQLTTLLPKVYGSFGLSDDLELEVTIPTVFFDSSADEDART